MRDVLRMVAFFPLGLSLATGARAATVIGAGPADTAVFPFGSPTTATYGETFVAPADPFLDGFALSLTPRPGTAPVGFAGYVMAWDGAEATGPVLYQSGEVVADNSGGTVEYAFDTGGLRLDAGSAYVLFLSTSEFPAPNTSISSYSMPAVMPRTYQGGQFVFANNKFDFGALTTSPWDRSFNTYNAVFSARFSPAAAPAAPLPPTAWAGLALLGGLGVVRVARKKSPA